jgi:anti-anti-sigma factor
MRAEMVLPFQLVEAELEKEIFSAVSPSVDEGRVIEDWIVETIEAKSKASTHEGIHDLLDRIALSRKDLLKPETKTVEKSKEKRALPRAWTRFRVERGRDLTIIVLTDKNLIKEDDLRQLHGDLLALVEGGNDRLVLNFAGVERLSAWAAGAIVEAVRECSRVRWGALRVCGLRSPLDHVFQVTGVDREVPVFSDETAAVSTPWPEKPELKPLPLEVLAVLAQSDAGVTSRFKRRVSPSTHTKGMRLFSIEDNMIRLISTTGPTRGKSISLNGQRLLIGRDSTCSVKIKSNNVSRFHASIEQRSSSVFLRDLGSTNGTTHCGRIIRGREVELRVGDMIQIGDLSFRVAQKEASLESNRVEDVVASWVGVDEIESETTGADTVDIEIPHDQELKIRIKSEVIGEVAIITPIAHDLDSEDVIDQLRESLIKRIDEVGDRQVVINLMHVGHVSGRAIGVLVAQHLRLGRLGGQMRICEANPRVTIVFEGVRLGILVECFPTLDDAVLTPWSHQTAAEIA